MIYTGMMPGELLAARKDMIDWDAKTIVGGGKKTKKRKVTPIVLADIIIPVLQQICNGVEGDKLIHINKDNFYTVYYETLEKAGCERLPAYHRHGTADIPISIVKEIMRHTKLSSTERYVHVDPSTMLQAVNKINVNNSVNNK